MAKKTFSVTEAATVLGISRTQVLRLIHQGKIKAEKIGSTFVIGAQHLPGIYRSISETEKKTIQQAVERTFRDYGEVIKKLGQT